jgi:hypothetical protein
MLYVVLTDGTVDKLLKATNTVRRDRTLACIDSNGRQVKSYERKDVLMFSSNERILRYVLEVDISAAD